MNQRKVGAFYEQKAAEFLTQSGFLVIAKNYHCRQGEVDLIGLHQGQLVFVEVKYRKSQRSGYPEEAVDLGKQAKICRTSEYFRIKHPEYEGMQVRYDVVAVCGEHLQWYQNAFEYVSGNPSGWRAYR